MLSKTQMEAVEDIRDASALGHAPIFLIGAGVSIDSGIPHISKLTEHLAKVQCYITNRAFEPRKLPGDERPWFGDGYRREPSSYIRDFGWPDPNCLNADLWQWIEQSFEKEKPDDIHRYLDYHVRAERIEDLLKNEPGLARGLSAVVQQQRKSRSEGNVRFDEKEWEGSGLWELEGSWGWKTLLARLTGSNQDYADTLFQSLIRDRCPGMVHRYLAFLTPLLGMRLFLTVNFDDLLEEAFRAEGHDPVVYAVSRDSPLPHPSLVRNQLSVVKMHGDAFRLKIGEDLDAPLDEDSRKRLGDYVGDHPLLVVLGIGGADRRVMDFIDLVAARGGSGQLGRPSVYWLHFGAQCPEPVSQLAKGKEGAVCAVPTYSPASFLLELLNRMTGTHPPSFHPYEPKMPRPIVPEPWKEIDAGKPPIWVFFDKEDRFDFGAPLDLAHFTASKAKTHIPIWIDLATMYQYEDAADEIIHKIRQYDRSVPPLSLPGGRDEEGVKKAVRRVCQALGRDRYVLALNGVGSFGRPPTWHHWPRHEVPPLPGDEEKKRLRNKFLLDLVEEAEKRDGPLRESILAFSVSPDDTDDPKLIAKLECWRTPSTRADQVPSVPLEAALRKRFAGFDDALLLLATFRRRRSYVALLQLLPRYLADKEEGASREEVDEFLRDIESRLILRVEGGEYWICRGMRNRIYNEGKQGTIPADWGNPEVDPLLQLARLSRIHRDIARYCYSHLYVASRDPFALLESVYHKVSSLRYLARLEAWLGLTPRDDLAPEHRRSLSWLVGRAQHLAGLEDAILAVRELRWQGLRVLRRAFAREREALLSLVCSDALIGWLSCLRKDDLNRCRADFWLEGLTLRRHAPESALDLDRAVERQVQELARQLLDLEGSALCQKMDFIKCLCVRFEQIGNLVTLPETKPADLDLNLDLDSYVKELAESCKKKLRKKPSLELVRALCDIWLCLRGIGRHEEAASGIGALFKSLVDARLCRTRSEDEDEIFEAMTVRWLRGAADQELTAVSPWSLRGASWAERRKVLESCGNVIAYCRRALRTIAWASVDTYARHRSYFLSLRGRAYYLRAYLAGGMQRPEGFAMAHRELDCALAGLAPDTGAHRLSLAVSLLRTAECLMVRADVFLDSRDSGALASAIRELDRAAEKLDRAERMLDGARQNLEWWSCLYQLRAQIQVEHLLLLLAGGHPSGETSGLVPVDARLPLALRAGLNAVRQGIDVLLPIPITSADGRTVEPHFRIERFLRIWVELAVSGGLLTRIGWQSCGVETRRDEFEDLWGRWTTLNEAAGLGCLNQQDIREQFKELNQGAPAPLACSPKARRLALGLIKKAVEGNLPWETSKVWKRLQED